jgi:hypothetical protein
MKHIRQLVLVQYYYLVLLVDQSVAIQAEWDGRSSQTPLQ